MTAILGISAYYHDSAAALLVDGKLVAAAQEERFSRQKHDARFPSQAIDYCLEQANLRYEDLEHVAFYEKPFLKYERLLETYLAIAPSGWRSFTRSMPVWLKQKLYLSREIHKHLEQRFTGRIIFPEHHESHAASAFFASPFTEAAILTADGVGEWATTTLGIGNGNRIELFDQIEFPHSLGLLYSAFTTYCGFRVNSGEAKLMGLAPLGQPRYADRIREKLIAIETDGSFRIDLKYFEFHKRLAMTSPRFHRLFEGPPRNPETLLSQRHKDLAASVQLVIEEVLLKMANHLHQKTGMKSLCIAGGLGLNCVANGRLRREGPFENIWVQPAAGDSGASLGAALFTWHHLLENPKQETEHASQSLSVYTGPEYSQQQIDATLQATDKLKSNQYRVRTFSDHGSLCDTVSDLLDDGKVIGWFQGRMEFGPRALGNRSILADPRCPNMQDRINHHVKFRESFRPFGPVVLASQANQFFEIPQTFQSPYMLFAEKVKPTTPSNLSEDPITALPAVTHVNRSSRIQTVTNKGNGKLNQLLESFAEKTGCPVLLNTSLNVRGQPIACTPKDALDVFSSTALDALVLENFLLTRTTSPKPLSDQPPEQRTFPAPVELSQTTPYLLLLGGLTSSCLTFWLWDSLSWALGICLFSLLLFITGLLAPRFLAPVIYFLGGVLRFIGFLLTLLIMAIVYYLALTPYALVLRLLGHRGLQTEWQTKTSSYWQPRVQPKSKSDYFRQF